MPNNIEKFYLYLFVGLIPWLFFSGSMTGGAGDFAYEFARYEQAPADVQKQQVEERASKITQVEE